MSPDQEKTARITFSPGGNSRKKYTVQEDKKKQKMTTGNENYETENYDRKFETLDRKYQGNLQCIYELPQIC